MIRALKLHPPSHPHFIFSKAFSFVFLSFLSFLWSRHMSSPFTCAQSTCSLFSASSFILLSQRIETSLGSLSSSFHTGFFFLLTSLATHSAISPLLKGRLCYLPKMQWRSKASPSGRECKKRQGERWGGIRDQTRLYNDLEAGYVISLSVSFLSP